MVKFRVFYPKEWEEEIIEADDLEEAEDIAWRAFGIYCQVERIEANE